MTTNGLSARLAALEARRRGQGPDRQRLAEAERRLIAWVDGLHGLEQIRAAQAALEAARRRIEQ